MERLIEIDLIYGNFYRIWGMENEIDVGVYSN